MKFSSTKQAMAAAATHSRRLDLPPRQEGQRVQSQRSDDWEDQATAARACLRRVGIVEGSEDEALLFAWAVEADLEHREAEDKNEDYEDALDQLVARGLSAEAAVQRLTDRDERLAQLVEAVGGHSRRAGRRRKAQAHRDTPGRVPGA